MAVSEMGPRGLPLDPGSHSITIDGLPQRYHVEGEGPLCLVHPGGPGLNWRYLRMPALELDVTVVYVEPIGTGSSGRLDDPAAYTLDRYVRCLHQLVQHLDAGPVHLLGHSHGGFVVLRLALEHPDIVSGLVLYETSARTGEEWFADVMQNLKGFAERHSTRPDVGDILAALDEEARTTTDDELTSVFRRQFPVYFADYWERSEDLGSLRESVRMYAGPNRGEDPTPYDVRARLSSIECPTLVIVGRHDVILSPRWAEELHEGIPGSELLVLEHSGHMGHLEEADEFARAVSRFVRR
jgi:proline-specific peptidase